MGFWLWTTLSFAVVVPPSLDAASVETSASSDRSGDAALETQVRVLARRVRAGDGAAAHQLGDLSLSRGNKALAAAWYLHGSELGDADARAHYEWIVSSLSDSDWSEVDRERARLTRWLEGGRPSGWLPIAERPIG